MRVMTLVALAVIAATTCAVADASAQTNGHPSKAKKEQEKRFSCGGGHYWGSCHCNPGFRFTSKGCVKEQS